MKCPVRSDQDCAELECAWWVIEYATTTGVTGGSCAVKKIGQAFSYKKPESKSNLFHN